MAVMIQEQPFDARTRASGAENCGIGLQSAVFSAQTFVLRTAHSETGAGARMITVLHPSLSVV